jgi:hypothetical protein
MLIVNCQLSFKKILQSLKWLKYLDIYKLQNILKKPKIKQEMIVNYVTY